MAITSMHLRRLLYLLEANEKKKTKALKDDVRAVIRSDTTKDSGFDCYTGIWSAFKNHIDGTGDFDHNVTDLISKNPKSRQRTHKIIQQALKDWLDEKKRWSNEGIKRDNIILAGSYNLTNPDRKIRINNFLALNVGSQPTKYYYPYFIVDLPLSEKTAKIGLWIMQQAFPEIPAAQLRIIDAPRGKSFSIKKNPLDGDEEELLKKEYAALIKEWNEIYTEKKKSA